MATSGGYLPRLTQYTDASTLVKKREISSGFYLVAGKDDRTPLGVDVNVVPVAWCFKALETPPGGKPISSTDKDSTLFKDIAARAGAQNSNCQAGIEYLVWGPDVAKLRDLPDGFEDGRARGRQGQALPELPGDDQDALVREHPERLAGPKVYECSVPVTVLPDGTALKEAVEAFNNPPAEAAPE